MGIDSIVTIGVALLGLVLPPIVYVWRDIVSRIKDLEKAQKDNMDEKEIRLLISDRLDPLKEDLQELKIQINKLINHIIEKR